MNYAKYGAVDLEKLNMQTFYPLIKIAGYKYIRKNHIKTLDAMEKPKSLET